MQFCHSHTSQVLASLGAMQHGEPGALGTDQENVPAALKHEHSGIPN